MAAELEIILRLLLAAVLGAAIGFQRERAGKQAGLRTNTLICVGGGHGHNISCFAHTAFDK